MAQKAGSYLRRKENTLAQLDTAFNHMKPKKPIRRKTNDIKKQQSK